jgi:G3E family GTPase
VVETTGLADPLPVALTFLGTELRDVTRLDSIITLVDAENFKSSVDLFNAEVSQSQITYGDIIILNKVDLVDEADVDLLELQIRDMKEGARIIRTSNSQVSIPMILSVGLFESDKYLETPADKHEHHDHQHDDHAHDHAHAEHQHDDHTNCDHDHGKCEHEGHDHSHHLENDGFTSLSFISDRPFSLRKFQYFLVR